MDFGATILNPADDYPDFEHVFVTEFCDAIAEEILAQSRRWGWGGIAADWHNPIEPIQVPDEINQIFWKQVRNQKSNGEKWVSADQFLAYSLRRYQDAGLLRDVRLDA